MCVTLKACRNHSGQLLSEYCLDCETVFCGSCSEHNDHRSESLTTSTVASHSLELRSLLQSSLEGPVHNLLNVLSKVHHIDSDLAVNYRTAQQSISETFNALIKSIERRRGEALSELDDIYHQKDGLLKNQASSCLLRPKFKLNMVNKADKLFLKITFKVTQDFCNV